MSESSSSIANLSDDGVDDDYFSQNPPIASTSNPLPPSSIPESTKSRKRVTRNVTSSVAKETGKVVKSRNLGVVIDQVDMEAFADTMRQLNEISEQITNLVPVMDATAGKLSSEQFRQSSPEERDKLAAKFTTMKQEFERLQKRQEKLKNQATIEKMNLEAKFQDLKHAFEIGEKEAEQQRFRYNSKVDDLREQLRQRNEEQETQLQAKARLKSKLQKIKESEKKIQEEANKLSTENNRLLTQLAKLGEDSEKNISRITELTENLRSKKGNYREEKRSLTDNFNREKKRHEATIATLQEQQRLDASKARELEFRKTTMENEFQTIKSAYENNSRLLTEQFEQEKIRLESEIMRLERTVETLILQQTQKDSEISVVREQLKQRRDEINNFFKQEELLRDQIFSMETQYNVLAATKLDLEQRLEEEQRLQKKEQRKKERAKLTVQRLEKEIKLLREKPEQFVKEVEKNPQPYSIYSSDEESNEEDQRPKRRPLMRPMSSSGSTSESNQQTPSPVTIHINTQNPPTRLQDDEDTQKDHQKDRTVSTSAWIRSSSGTLLPQMETIDIQNFRPQIPEQAKKWEETLSNIAKSVDIGDPHRVYEAVERILKTDHPEESEFYHDFYLLVRTVEGKSGRKRGQFWVAETEDLKHLAHNIIEAATETITVVPLKEASFFPLSKADLANGISLELQQFKEKPQVETPKEVVEYLQKSSTNPSSSSTPAPISEDINDRPARRYAWNAQRRKHTTPPSYPLPTPSQLETGLPAIPRVRDQILPGRYQDNIEKIHRQELQQKALEAKKPGSGWSVEEINIARRNETRYGSRYPQAPLRGIDQRLAEYDLRDRLDPSLVLFDKENTLVITYNFWDFIQQRILGKINRAQPNYVVELQDKPNHGWTNVIKGTDFNDIAHYLADHLWENLQVRQIGGPLTRKPSMLSVKKYLDNQAIKRITDELVQIEEEYRQPWQDRIFSMLQAAVDSGFFAAFREGLNDLNIKFDIGEPRFKSAMKNMQFASLVAAHYQKTVVDTSRTATGYQIANANSNVSNAIDSARESMGMTKITTGVDYVNESSTSGLSFLTSVPRPTQRLTNQSNRFAPTQSNQPRLIFDFI